MADFTGQNIQNVAFKKQSDVVIKKLLSTSALVNVEADTTLQVGQLLVTSDGGESFSVADELSEPNGVLCEALSSSEKAEVLVSGVVRQSYLDSFVDAHKPHLFANKIILK